MTIYDVRVNHLKNPLGFHMDRTAFSWKVTEARGKRQTAARLVVATDEGLKQKLLDTGFDENADSLGWKVPIELKPRTRYFYQITVRSDADEEASSEICWFETGKMDESWVAKWITCDSGETRHPDFEKQIQPEKEVSQARLYICGLGLYEAYFNGNRISKEYLTPYSNDYNRWVQYQTYDVTEDVKDGGTLSILLGNGWYKGRFGFASDEDKSFYGNEWKLIAELRLTYADGTEDVVGTDEHWQVSRSNFTFSNIYDGEHRDDTLKPLPPEQAALCEPPAGQLGERMSTPVTVHEVFNPVDLIHTPRGELVLDMGQEFAGIFRLRVDLPRGAKVRIQTGEILQQGNFYNENLRSAKSEYVYTSGGEPTVITPHFTYYGYRYVKIEGIPDLKPEDFQGLALYSDIPERGRMRTGHDLVNKLISNVRWGLKSNFLDVPTDCPQRNERMGWTGDAQVFSATATYLQDTYAFYAKYLRDMWEEQQDTDGMVPNVIPAFGMTESASVWGDAACIIPWNLYCFYGDRSILEDQYESMKAWVEYVRRVDGNNHGWRHVFHYADWLALDNLNRIDQPFGGTDPDFIANIYYAASAEIVAKAAKILGKTEDEAEYRALAEKQFDEVKREYYSPTGRCCVKTQTALLLTLKYGLSSNQELTASMLKNLFEWYGGKLKTGFVGTPMLCNVLSDNGMDDLAWRLLLNEEYPGWLHEVKLGATTVWERWNSVLDDGSISGTGMNSLNHYAYGSILEWMFRHVAGMEIPEDIPGCRRIDFRPSLNWDLREQETEYDSPCGLYKSSWRMADPSHVELRVSVPFGGNATLALPYAPEDAYQAFQNMYDGVCLLEPGEYVVSYELDASKRFDGEDHK